MSRRSTASGGVVMLGCGEAPVAPMHSHVMSGYLSSQSQSGNAEFMRLLCKNEH